MLSSNEKRKSIKYILLYIVKESVIVYWRNMSLGKVTGVIVKKCHCQICTLDGGHVVIFNSLHWRTLWEFNDWSHSTNPEC